MTDEHLGLGVDDLPSEEELAEASALARALERETLDDVHVKALLPALEAGHLLKMARAAEPSEARLMELYADVEALLPTTSANATATSANIALPARWRAARRWLLVATTAAAAAAWGLSFTSRDASAPHAGVRLPAPTLAMLDAQRRAVQGIEGDNPTDAATANAQPLAAATRVYRMEMLTQLRTEYER